jgi:hypothetical protein
MASKYARRALTLTALGAVGGVGGLTCSPPPQRKPLEMEPIGTVRNTPRPAADDPDASTTTPNSSTPTGVATVSSGPCTGGDVELSDDAFHQCEAPMPKSLELPSGLRDKLEVKVTPSVTQVAGGGRVDLQIVLRNKSSDALPLWFNGEPTPRFEVEAVDAKSRRVDVPPGKPPAWPKGTSPPAREVHAAKVTLDKGGTAHVHVTWDAVKMKWAPTQAKTWDGRGFPRTPAGSLPAGKYTLRVVVPIVGVIEKNDLDVPKVTIEVGS